MGSPVRVLVVDDSAAVRKIVQWGLELDPDIEVVGSAADAFVARDLVLALSPDVVTLDVDMPGMDGVEFLRRLLPTRAIPVVMLSSLTQGGTQAAFEAIAAGAVDFVAKPTSDIAGGLPAMLEELREKIHMASRANMGAWQRSRAEAAAGVLRVPTRAKAAGRPSPVIAIGASTGGPDAIAAVLRRFPADMPGVVIVQHMPAEYTRRFAESLDTHCAMQVRQAEHGDRLEPGTALLAPGNEHLRVRRGANGFDVLLDQGERVSGHRPSVDVLFESVARAAGGEAVGVILTGMGRDGARGLLTMRKAGARTLAQDEATSVVFGMPKVAVELGAVERVAPLDEIAPLTIERLG
jgi:two-component system chemotaxis response regulator CheB